jgi:hypothetical protein
MQQTFETSRLGDVLKELYIEGFKYFNSQKFYEPNNKSYIIPRVNLLIFILLIYLMMIDQH